MRTPSFWQHPHLPAYLLLPAALLYAAGAALDRLLTTPKQAPLPVIAVGNATAGGAGKTPTAIALAALLRELGETPHIISRGYGGKRRGPHRVDPSRDTAQDVGDEALLLANAAPTWVGANRLDSAIAARAAGASIVIADDALQHHALKKDITLLVVDAATGFGNGFLLPAGPLREPVACARKRCDLAVLIGRDDPHHLAAQLGARIPCERASLQPAADTAFLHGPRWLAFTGIAYPEKFFATLRDCGAQIGGTRSFADHHPFTRDEIAQLKSRAQEQHLQLVTTEKDWVRIPPDLQDGIRPLPVALQFENASSMRHIMETLLLRAKS